MSGGSQRDEDVLPVYDAPEPIEVEIDDATVVGRASRRGFGPGRGAGIAAGILVVLVAGIAIGSVINEPRPSSTPTTPSTTPAPNVACQPQRSADPPPLTLSAPEFDESAVGLFGVSYGSLESAAPVPAWLGPPQADAIAVGPDTSLELASRPLACMTDVRVWAHPTDTLSSGGDGVALADMTVGGTLATIPLNGAPIGDWVLRVEANFAAQDQSQGAEIVTRSFFRVVVAKGFRGTPTPGTPAPPTPAVTPLFGTCTSEPVSADIPVIASVGGGEPVTGGTAPLSDASPSEAPTLAIEPGDHVQIAVFGGCAVSWTIRLLDPSSLGGTTVEFQRNDNDDPLFASQNAWDVVVEGTALLQAHLHFPGGPTIDRTWLVVAQPFQVPAAFVVAEDGTRGEALPGCGLAISLANGYNTADQCGSAGVSLGPAAFHVPAWTPITFEIPGWQLRQWSAACGGLSGDAGDIFTPTDGCDLGGGLTDAGGPLTDPATFVLPPTDTVVVVQAGAMSPNRDFFSVPYYIHVIAK